MKRWVIMESTYKQKDFGTNVVLFARNYDSKWETTTIEIPYEPYFYIPADHREIKSQHIKRIEPHIYIDALGRSVKKVITFVPSDVTKVRDQFDWTDEADVMFDKRFLVDHHIKYAFTYENGVIKPTKVDAPMLPLIMYFDIETLAPEGTFASPHDASYPIITIQCGNNYNDKMAIFTCQMPPTSYKEQVQCKDETELLRLFSQYVKELDPDILWAWNSQGYDFPYIINRAKRLGISIKVMARQGEPKTDLNPATGKFRSRIGGRATFDMMEAFKKWNIGGGQRESNGLKSVISDSDLLGDKAFSYQDLGPILNKITTEKRWDELMEYCLNDVRALQVIDKTLGLCEYFESVRFVAGSKIDDALYNSLIIEMLLWHYGIKPMPTKRHYEKTKDDDFEGAFVFKPEIGVHEMVGCLDAAALYPNIIVGFNVSPDIDGVVVTAIKDMMALREKYRALKLAGDKNAATLDSSAKTIVNSFYGVMGATSFRLYNRDKAAFITGMGQTINKKMRDIVTSQNKRVVVYADSVAKDSILHVFINNEFKSIRIEDLFTHVDYNFGEKEYCDIQNVFIKTLNNDKQVVFRPIKYVMRHKCGKQMFRVSTKYTYVDVTEDHSLITHNLTHIKPQLAKRVWVNKENSLKYVPCGCEKIHYTDYVYDIEVEDFHRFFANGILVSNTDSVFFKPLRDVDELVSLEKIVNDELAKWSDEQGSAVHFKVKAEKLFSRLLFKPKKSNRKEAGKKKYAGHLIWKDGKDKDELSNMGMELNRSDNPVITKECLKYFLEEVLLNGNTSNAVNFVRETYTNVKTGNISIYDISMPKEVRKLNYENQNAWVNGINYAKSRYNYTITEGTKPRLIYLKHNNVVCIDEDFDTDLIKDEIDWVKMADKILKGKLESYLWAIGDSWERVVKGQKSFDQWGF